MTSGRSRETVDALKHGQSFTDARRTSDRGTIMLRRRQRFVSRQGFIMTSRIAPDIALNAFRTDQEAAFDHEASSVYDF